MNAWLTLQQALAAPGLRLAPVRAGLPSPWSEFARSCFHVKRIPYSLVDARDADRGLTSIRTLTGQESSVEGSTRHCEEIVLTFGALRSAGHDYLLGSTLTALDLAWAAFAALIQPLSEGLCPMKPLWRELYTWLPSVTPRHTLEALLSHRERTYRDWLTLPVDLG